jgi:hypothetical protein
MNDWLLGMQQRDSSACPDEVGRFYDPRRPDFGAPHASSTGVYLEGLIDAWSVAKDMNDVARREAYRRAIVSGLRSLMQLQFRSTAEMYYVVSAEAVLGGIRTRLYDNTIRVDNVQHGFMAILRILEEFSDSDYTD